MGRIRKPLFEARRSLRKSQAEVASIVKISRVFYTQIENGYRNPSLAVAKEIAKALKKTVDELFVDVSEFLDEERSEVNKNDT